MSLLTFLFARGEKERSDELDRQLREHNAARVERGVMSPEEYNVFEERLATGGSNTFDDQIEDAFEEGASEGLANMQATVKGTLTDTVKGALGFVPWWAWFLLLGFILYQVGAWAYLKRRVATAP